MSMCVSAYYVTHYVAIPYPLYKINFETAKYYELCHYSAKYDTWTAVGDAF